MWSWAPCSSRSCERVDGFSRRDRPLLTFFFAFVFFHLRRKRCPWGTLGLARFVLLGPDEYDLTLYNEPIYLPIYLASISIQKKKKEKEIERKIKHCFQSNPIQTSYLPTLAMASNSFIVLSNSQLHTYSIDFSAKRKQLATDRGRRETEEGERKGRVYIYVGKKKKVRSELRTRS